MFVFVEAYNRQARPDIPVDRLITFPHAACTLILYSELHGQVTNGGFVQLIHNRYGKFVFGSPLADDLERWGASRVADIIREAGAIYQSHKSFLERKRTLDQFSALYSEFPHFEALESRFYEVMDEQTTVIRKYVEQHRSQFAHIV
nr:DMP19 family protein [Hymenobacter pini]